MNTSASKKQSKARLAPLPPHTFYPGETLLSPKGIPWRLVTILASLPDGYIVTNSAGNTADTRNPRIHFGDPLLGGWSLYKANPDTIEWRTRREAMIAEARNTGLFMSKEAFDEMLNKYTDHRQNPFFKSPDYQVPPFTSEVPERRVIEMPPNPNHFAHPDSYSRAKAAFDDRQAARRDPTNLV